MNEIKTIRKHYTLLAGMYIVLLTLVKILIVFKKLNIQGLEKCLKVKNSQCSSRESMSGGSQTPVILS